MFDAGCRGRGSSASCIRFLFFNPEFEVLGDAILDGLGEGLPYCDDRISVP